MKKLKILFSLMIMIFMSASIVSCGLTGNDKKIAEKVELADVKFEDVDFKNSDAVELKQDDNVVTISGTIDAMSDAQKEAYGKDGITHVVTLKFKFDKEKTLSKFELKGNETKVFSDTTSVENYVGSITDLLDSEDDEDAYANLILLANTSEYKLVSTYTDGTVSSIDVKITATLATATTE